QYVLHREEESMARRQTLVGVLPALLGTYYACQLGWDGVETLLSPLGDVSEERLVLVDGEGRIVVDSAQLAEQGTPAAALTVGAVSIEVDGGSVGSLAVVPLQLESYSSGERAYIAQVNRALLWAVLVA